MAKNCSLYFTAFVLLVTGCLFTQRCSSVETDFVWQEVDPLKQNLQLYWKDEAGQPFRSIGSLRTWLAAKGQRLVFAMNGGIFKEGNVPQGLFIQNKRVLVPLDTMAGSGNFYLKPNGVFYLTTKGNAVVCPTQNFISDSSITFATQSGPLLLIDSSIHPAFTKGSANVHIRNGVGILPNGNAIFAMSKEKISFYDFARWFLQRGCRNALYLDGFVSRTYLPAAGWEQTDGDFAVIIGLTVTEK
jgi:uncharacterized protein YigE (DUF2233 family)